jgi:hypothetical protein
MKTHRDLHPFPLDEAIKALSGAIPRARVMTMAIGQWDGLLSAAYAAGFILLELDENETPMRAYLRVE